ncbi:myelin-associated glycoprotein-like isoform X2 [Plectropomus leopardus]|uniref:myelin-associated glycoprotein-like isoform X2 n=1 Tax=Plectropomus leopardus TaxID=160734 RepID=UPI001C4D9F00|nr:myelin-associated glycoprotein-like isoform X2 [Plectropomus leopardus]
MDVVLAVVTLLITLMQGVSCNTWGVTLPRSIMGIADSCVTIPCRFEIPNNEEANFVNCSDGGIWRRGSIGGRYVLNARNPSSNMLQGQIVGDILKKNCTALFRVFPKNFNDMYFFRLECLNHIKFTFSDGVNISVQPELPPPRLISKSPLSEGDRVTLHCVVPLPCSILPPSITWYPRDDSRQERTITDQVTMMSTVHFIASADHNNQTISCSVSYPLTAGGSSLPSATTQRLNILYAPRATVVTLNMPVPVPEGRTVIFTCQSDANPPVSLYIWFRFNNGNLTKKGQGEMLILQARPEDSDLYLCEAQNEKGSQRSRPVFLEVNITSGGSECVVLLPYILFGVVLVLYILTAVVVVWKYQSISRRLKIELKGEHTYADLKTCGVASDYDQLQFRQPKTMPTADVPNYENPIALQANLRNQPPSKWT